MTKKHVWIIRLASIWTFYVWAVLVRNMVIDHANTFAFRAVHIVLAVISFAFAGAIWWVSNLISKEIRTRGAKAQDQAKATVDDLIK